jgi:hypothetical protein
MAGLARTLALLEAPNAVPVRVRKTQAIAAIQLLEFGNDERLSPRYRESTGTVAPRRDRRKSAPRLDVQKAAAHRVASATSAVSPHIQWKPCRKKKHSVLCWGSPLPSQIEALFEEGSICPQSMSGQKSEGNRGIRCTPDENSHQFGIHQSHLRMGNLSRYWSLLW